MIIKHFRELKVYQRAKKYAIEIFEISKSFPSEERYSLTDQIRRASRSVCANIGEAWRKRRYKAAFRAKLNDSETEASETQVWLEFSLAHGYISEDVFNRLDREYEEIISMLVDMIHNANKWVFKSR